MSDVETYTASIPVSSSLLDDMDPIEFVTEIMRQFQDYAVMKGYKLVHGYLRIEMSAYPPDILVSGEMQLISVTASCRKVVDMITGIIWVHCRNCGTLVRKNGHCEECGHET